MTDFSFHIYTAADGSTLPYRLLVPDGYDFTHSYPMVLFLHGAGERGTDNDMHLGNGLEYFVTPKAKTSFPAFIIVPQCPVNEQWVNMAWDANSGVRPLKISKSLDIALQIFDSVEKEYNIDRDREYVAGVSMGGYGTWDCVTRFPGRFAAAIPVCGGGDEDTVTNEVAKVPLWALHSADDSVVKVRRSQNMIKALIAKGGQPHYTEYPREGHASWDRAFQERDILPWLFAQKRGLPDTYTITLQK